MKIMFRNEPGVYIDAVVSSTGKRLVVIDSVCDLIEDVVLSPSEAERYGRALLKAAAAARSASKESK